MDGASLGNKPVIVFKLSVAAWFFNLNSEVLELRKGCPVMLMRQPSGKCFIGYGHLSGEYVQVVKGYWQPDDKS